MKINQCVLLFISFYMNFTSLSAQENVQSCKVALNNLVGKYTGECKNGFANGKGEAVGLHRYTGIFKNGLPNEKGTYYYNDSMYYSGSFQDGIKEGKGETHYIRRGLPDSIIMGYWSADDYRGKQYINYKFKSTQDFDITEISASKQSGNTITINILTTSGTPNGSTAGLKRENILFITDLISVNGNNVRKSYELKTAFKSILTYELNGFPAYILATLSNGQTIEFELYKCANWTVRLFLNR